MNSRIVSRMHVMRKAGLLVCMSVLFGYVQAQDFDNPDMPAGIEDIESDEGISNHDHRSDNDFLRRYSGGDSELNQLSMSLSSRIRRRLIFNLTSTGNIGTGDFAPFWFTSNRQGLSPVEPSGAMLDLGMDGGMRLPNGFRFDYGINVAVAANYQSDFYLQQMYVDAGYKWLDLSLGTKERWGETVNHELSSGSLTWSGNSRPIPQIRLEVPEFTRLRGLGGLVSLKGHIAYGWYQDSRWRETQASKYTVPAQYTDRILHHSKSFFIKVGDTERFPLELTAGLEMNAMFGGTRHNMRTWPDEPVIKEYEYPHDVGAYLQAFLPLNRAGEQTKDNGNSLGSWHLALDMTFSRVRYRLYYEHYFEDHSSMLGVEYKADLTGAKGLVSYGFRRNWLDGLYGLEVDIPEGKYISGMVLEVLNTRGQCGSLYRYPAGQILEGVDGHDDFYNHEFYRSYSHYGYANGSPVLSSPIYNKDGNLSFRSNRILMYHFGMNGSISKHLDYRMLVTYSSHLGTYDYPFSQKEELTSVMLECFYRFGGRYSWRIGISAAADYGSSKMPTDNRGVMLTVSRLWKML